MKRRHVLMTRYGRGRDRQAYVVSEIEELVCSKMTVLRRGKGVYIWTSMTNQFVHTCVQYNTVQYSTVHINKPTSHPPT